MLIAFLAFFSQSLIQHYHHSVAVEAAKIEMGLSKQETELEDLLGTTVDDVRVMFNSLTSSTLFHFSLKDMLSYLPMLQWHTRIVASESTVQLSM